MFKKLKSMFGINEKQVKPESTNRTRLKISGKLLFVGFLTLAFIAGGLINLITGYIGIIVGEILFRNAHGSLTLSQSNGTGASETSSSVTEDEDYMPTNTNTDPSAVDISTDSMEASGEFNNTIKEQPQESATDEVAEEASALVNPETGERITHVITFVDLFKSEYKPVWDIDGITYLFLNDQQIKETKPEHLWTLFSDADEVIKSGIYHEGKIAGYFKTENPRRPNTRVTVKLSHG